MYETIGILSPEQNQTRVTRNILHCLEHGCQLGWLIDPDERAILIYSPGQQPQLLEEPEAVLSVPSWIASLQLQSVNCLGWLKLTH